MLCLGKLPITSVSVKIPWSVLMDMEVHIWQPQKQRTMA